MNTSPVLPLLRRCTNPAHLLQLQAHLLISGDLYASVFLHNALIRAFSFSSSPTSALPLLPHLLRSSLLPDSHTLPFLLRAASLSPRRLGGSAGAAAHALALKLALAADLFVNNALIHFHSSSGNLPAARILFLSGSPIRDAVTYNSMVTAFVRAGELTDARELFDEMPERNVISWSAMIAGYVQKGLSNEAIKLFFRMQAEGFKPQATTLVSVLAACAHIGALDQGKWVHGYLRGSGIRMNVFVGTALIDMYAKCGEVELALKVFDGMEERNLLAWTTMIKGLAMHGRGVEALELFKRMETFGVVPDDIAFIGALCACTHAGQVNRGRQIFDSMSRCYGIKPKIEHYGCMVDLLARNGLLNEAREVVESMPMAPDAAVWGALMAGCRFHKNVELAEYAFKHLIRLESDTSGVYVLLSNIYAAAGRHTDAQTTRNFMKKQRVEKTPGCSLVEIGGTMHQFLVGDTSHPQINHILIKLREIESRIRLEGYVPDMKEVLLDIDEDEKEDALAWHSERLAIAFGLLSTEDGVVIRVVKNLRVCADCHHVTKLISKVYDREIIVRDRTRFHDFKGGSCTCKDYW